MTWWEGAKPRSLDGGYHWAAASLSLCTEHLPHTRVLRPRHGPPTPESQGDMGPDPPRTDNKASSRPPLPAAWGTAGYQVCDTPRTASHTNAKEGV